MRELREPHRHDRRREHRVAERPEVGEGLFEHLAVVEPGHDHHLRVELDPALRQARELLHDVRHARIVQQHFPSVPRRRVHRHVERRQAVLEDPRDVAFLHVGERGEIPVGEGEAVVIIAHVQRAAQAGGKSLNEAELAAVGAAPDRGRLEFDAERLAVGAFDVEGDLFPARQAGLDRERVVRREELPVEEVGELPPVHRMELGARDDAQFLGDGVRENAADANHVGYPCAKGKIGKRDLPLWNRALTWRRAKCCGDMKYSKR